MRQTYAQVDLGALKRNISVLKQEIGQDVMLMAVVKADAYGHGLVQVANAAKEAQADWLGVALVEEGIALRQAGMDLPILVLAGLSPQSTLEAVEAGLTLCVYTPAHIHSAQQAAEKVGTNAKVHIKLDTGMNRIGVKDEQSLSEILHHIKMSDRVELSGAFTHFASADSKDPGMTDSQLRRFHAFSRLLPTSILLHASGTSALLNRPDARFQMVRAGISIYGYSPVSTHLSLEPVLSWFAEVTHVKEILPGETVSYGANFTANKTVRVATLAVGYGDGYSRLLSGQADVLLHGTRCRVLGRVCMDQIMVDVTAIPQVKPGDLAVLLGKDGEEMVLADELATLAGTISYEVLLSITARVPRIYRP